MEVLPNIRSWAISVNRRRVPVQIEAYRSVMSRASRPNGVAGGSYAPPYYTDRGPSLCRGRDLERYAVTALLRAAKLLRSFCSLGGITAMQ